MVEDDKPIGELLAGVINEEEGYRAIHVTRPSEALRTMEQIKPDLLVLDVGLPGMSGLELYDRLHKDERLRSVPVMFETAVSREHASEFKQARDPQGLSEAVRSQRAHRRHEGARTAGRGLVQSAAPSSTRARDFATRPI